MQIGSTTVRPRWQLTIAVIPGLVTLVIVVAAFVAILRLRESRVWVDHTRDVIETSDRMLTRIIDAETGVRAFVITGDAQFLDPYNGSDAEVHRYIQMLRQLTRDNAIQQRRLTVLTGLVNERFASLDRIITLRRSTGTAAVLPAMIIGKVRMDSVRRVVTSIEAEEHHLLAVRDDRDRWNQTIALFIIGVGGLVAVVVAVIVNGMLAWQASQLEDTNVELTTQAQRLEEQAIELESQASELEITAAELEVTNVELEEQAMELEKQRDAAQAARAKAEQANAAKARFLSVMSHELRTPLNAIAGYVDIIDTGVHGPVTDNQREDIRRIKRAVAQLTSIINDILNFAKLEAGEVRLDIGSVHVGEALANASAIMEPQAVAKGVQFTYTPCDPDIVALADRERLQQIMLNLLSNAVKYTDAGGKVQVVCLCGLGTVSVRVADTGRGIAPADLHRIFDPFVQLSRELYSPSEGVGLGLAISRDLARAMGSDITVESHIGSGSVFEITLPAAGIYAGQSMHRDDDTEYVPEPPVRNTQE